MSETNCELCSAEIEDGEVEFCDKCGQDGMCNDCLMDHDCSLPATPQLPREPAQ